MNRHDALPDRLAPAALEAVDLAGRVTRRVQGRLAEIAAAAKDDRSPVTVADFAAQAIVTLVLRRRLGGMPHAMVAEESTEMLAKPEGRALLDATVDAVRGVEPGVDAEATLDAIAAGATGDGAGEFWTLDPVDGTKGFLRNGQYAIALARVVAGRVELATLGCPGLSPDPTADPARPDPRGSLFLAARGRGAFEIAPDTRIGEFPTGAAGGIRPIRARTWSPGEAIAMCESVESGHSDQDLSRRMMEGFGPPAAPLRLDSQAKYAVVARGQAHAYLRLPTRPGYVERIWDHAAGSLLAAEAGCRVGDVDGRELDFGHGRGLERNRGVICAAKGLYPRLVEAYAAALSGG